MRFKFLLVIYLLLPIIFFLAAVVCGASAVHADKPDWAGQWGIWGGQTLDISGNTWYKGTIVSTDWKRIETSPGIYNWSSLDNLINTAYNNGHYIGIVIYTGGHKNCPDWLYNNGVPKVLINEFNEVRSYPYYYDNDFKFYFYRFLGKVKAHIDGYSPAIKDKIVLMQAPYGTSDDPKPWYGQPAAGYEQYAIDYSYPNVDQEWIDYNYEVWNKYFEIWGDSDYMTLLFSAGTEEKLLWVTEQAGALGIDFMTKGASVMQGHHGKNEMDGNNNWKSGYYKLEQPSGLTIRVRGEFTAAEMESLPWYAGNNYENQLWSEYWQCLWTLNWGYDMMNHRGDFFTDFPDYWTDPVKTAGYKFFTKWAGYKYAPESLGAWIAFTDDLDVNNTSRFPESTYGTLNLGRNLARYQSIISEYAPYGAVQEDWGVENGILDSPYLGPLGYARKVEGLNDANYNVWRDNYYMFMTQISPNTTDQGYWRVGSKTQPYGRYARGFNHAKGKNAIYLDIDDGLFSGSPLNGQYPMTVRVVYFDQGNGKWSLKYDAVNNPNKTLTYTNTNTNTWKERSVVLSDAYFGNRGPSGSDISIVNADTTDEKFHMVEITRDRGATPACSEGQIASSCLCGGTAHSTGYCCSGVWQSGACSVPACTDQGYRCCSSCQSGTAQSGLDSSCSSGNVCCGICQSQTTLPGDLNSDSKVDVIDLGIFLSNWGKTTQPASDLNRDGNVDVVDLGILLGNWG